MKKKELVINIIDLFEDILDKNNIKIPDEDRTGDETEASLYGMTYFKLEEDISNLIDSYLEGKGIKEEKEKRNMLDTKIISAFPACGKTHLFDNIHREFTVLDSDSSKFSWIYDELTSSKIRNPKFPENYINHIKENIGRVNYIFVSTHKEVRDALKEAGIEFTVVIPENDVDTKREWIRRCISRGNDSKFCDVIATYWTEWLEEIERNEKNIIKINSNQYLSDIIDLKGNMR